MKKKKKTINDFFLSAKKGFFSYKIIAIEQTNKEKKKIDSKSTIIPTYIFIARNLFHVLYQFSIHSSEHHLLYSSLEKSKFIDAKWGKYMFSPTFLRQLIVLQPLYTHAHTQSKQNKHTHTHTYCRT